MGTPRMKVRQWPYQSSPLGYGQFFVILVLLFLGTKFVSCEVGFSPAESTYFQYSDDSLMGLQYLWKNWIATPNANINLAGWRKGSLKNFPCQSLFYGGESSYSSWRGVQCTRECSNSTNGTCLMNDVHIIGLTLSNAEIVGYLPEDALFYLNSLATLELTGNPNLSGPLPVAIEGLYLNSLDLHDNALDGNIPEWSGLWNLLYLDLSGNWLTGEFPYNQTLDMTSLEVLKLGRNHLEGFVPPDTLYSNSKLETLDISNNNFIGVLPSFINNTKLQYLDVSGNLFQGPLPNLTRSSSLCFLNLSGNNFNGNITNLTSFMNVTALTKVDLSYNQLSFPSTFSWTASDLGSIQELYLDGNEIEGVLDITRILAEQNTGRTMDDNIQPELLARTGSLRILSLMNNSITDVEYDGSTIENYTVVFKLQGNPYCENEVDTDDGWRCYCKQICFNTPAATKQIRRRIIVISTCSSIATIITILSIVVGVILLKNIRYKQALLLSIQKKFDKFDIKPTMYSYNELRVATRDFDEANKLGQGGYGAVYKGVLPSGQVVAVKQLFMKTTQGLDEFSNEIVLITGMKHRNLVNLKGCCLRESARILVYEYVDNLDVDQILLGPERQVVSWNERLKICLGIARGLNYLHVDAQPRVIHRDIKASNILLDRNLEPKIADFGLALLFPEEESHIMTIHVAGTKGYLAPEYAVRGHLSDKVDVYSFGILVLEIICSRRNIDESLPADQKYLSDWAWKLYKENKLMELVDPSLQLSDKEEEDVQRVIKLALQCIQNDGERRPHMARIVSILQDETNSNVVALSCTEELKHSYEFQKFLKPNYGGLTTLSESLSSSSKNLHRRHDESFTTEEELNEIDSSRTS